MTSSYSGLRICPDLDTIIYTLSGKVNPATRLGHSGGLFRLSEGTEKIRGAKLVSIRRS